MNAREPIIIIIIGKQISDKIPDRRWVKANRCDRMINENLKQNECREGDQSV